jgi:hypothetical protein
MKSVFNMNNPNSNQNNVYFDKKDDRSPYMYCIPLEFFKNEDNIIEKYFQKHSCCFHYVGNIFNTLIYILQLHGNQNIKNSGILDQCDKIS